MVDPQALFLGASLLLNGRIWGALTTLMLYCLLWALCGSSGSPPFFISHNINVDFSKHTLIDVCELKCYHDSPGEIVVPLPWIIGVWIVQN